MSIQETRIKIKGFSRLLENKEFQEGVAKKALLFMGFFLLLGTSFLAGRISALIPKHRNIQIEYPPLIKTNIPEYEEPPASSSTSTDDPDNSSETKSVLTTSAIKTTKMSQPKEWNFAASKTGKAYYPKGCKGLSRIKPENRVYFMTSAEAETSGLALAKGCNSPP